MEQPAINETLVRQYLLGLLAEDECERLEMVLLTDDRIYETLTALEDEVEDELIDQYLDGELTKAERDKFEHVFLKKPERAHKLMLIKDLKDHVMVTSHAEISLPKIAPTYSSRNRIPAVGVFQNPLFGLATAAALTLALFCCVWLWIRVNSLGTQLRQAQEGHATDTALKEQVEQLKRRNEELTANLQRSEEQRTTLEQELAKSSDSLPNKPAPTFASIVLLPSLRSTDQTISTLNLPRGVPTARLIFNVDRINPRDYKSVSAVVKKQSGGPEVWRSDVKLQPTGNNARGILTIPAQKLAEGRYTAELEGLTTKGQPELVGLYLFQVVHGGSPEFTVRPRQ